MMARAGLPIGVGLLALCLAGVVLLEVSGAMPDSDGVTPVRANDTLPAPARPALQGPAPQGPERVPDWAATVRARPLFSPTRRPPAVAAQTGPDAPVTAGLPRMTGVLVTPTVRRAIFAGPDGKSLVIPEGGTLGAYTVLAVRAGQAVVSGPGGERTLTPAFDPNAPAPATSAPAVAAPGLPGLPGFRLDGGVGGVPGGIPGLGSPNPRPAAGAAAR